MKLKPFSAADLLRQGSPRKFASNSNRFASIRDESPAPGNGNGRRFRSPSVKRKNDDAVSYSDMVSIGLPPSQVPSQQVNNELLDMIGVNTAKVTSLCEKVQGELVTLGAEPEICTIFTDLCEAIRCINDSQKRLAESQGNPPATLVSQVQAPPKRVKQVTGSGNPTSILVDITRPSPAANTVTESKEEADHRRFREAVKDAERSTLVFNLNMGKVPIMNRETISKKATLALTTMAAKNEGKFSSTPSEESVMAIDDVLSMTTDMSFFGNTTKSYKNPKDDESGSFCTLPVKYEFKDKDTRIHAETTLRTRCKVRCTTPYPTILRECIKQVIDAVKVQFPGEFVRVTVDPSKMCLSVARRGNKDTEWTYLREDIILPKEVLDVTSRTVPKDLSFINLPSSLANFTPNKPTRGRSGRNPSTMEVSSQNE